MAVTKLLVKLGAHALVLNKAGETPALAASGAGMKEGGHAEGSWGRMREGDVEEKEASNGRSEK
jgi:hypothetical protein